MKKVLLILCLFVLSSGMLRGQSGSLDISPSIQNTYVWCWAAVAQMVFEHYGLPNMNPAGDFQCGIVAAYFGPNSSCWQNCYSCAVPAGVMSNIKRLVDNYGSVLNSMGAPSANLRSVLSFRPLSFAEIRQEIDAGRPIIAGISPGGFLLPNASQHVTVVVGYTLENGFSQIIVNDPFPFWHQDFTGRNNPYLGEPGALLGTGQYLIAYQRFVTGLRWGNTIWGIRKQ